MRISGAQGSDSASIQIVLQFNDALNHRHLEQMMALTTPQCVFENTYPAPDGERIEGQAAFRSFWLAFFQDSVQSRFEVEEIFGSSERVVMRWTYHWVNKNGQPSHIRGVDIYRIENDQIAEKLSYVKG
ncbi:MAG: nuclear transport factor 2 family protein [Anaerolineales bacterium]|jgi:ketosteroid isomerase-like protein|nr:nuclear transport factor 2 family protein [Anaerolineales bacterium]